jgi:tetratricopeptide (TPR) repeat protein
MTGDFVPMSSIPASRYALVSLPEWQNLLRHFELSDGFAFVVLLVPDADGAEGCRQALQRFLAASDRTLLTIPFPRPDDLKELPSRLLDVETPPQVGAVWVAAVVSERADDYEAWLAAWREGTAKLNQFRNPLRGKFAVPLVFVGAPWMQEVLREMAPDLWSVRTLVVRLELLASAMNESVMSSRSVAASPVSPSDAAGPDPEYALKAAARMRGRPGQELQLANLLYRAGQGFLARSDWQQAEQVLSEAVALRTRHEPESVGLAESVYDLAEALRWQYDYKGAVECLEQALRIYRQVGSVLGEANCIRSLGDIALRRSDHETARRRYEEALSLYERISEPYSIGGAHRRLARLAGDESERKIHAKAARNAWVSIEFTDLVQELDDEFGTED